MHDFLIALAFIAMVVSPSIVASFAINGIDEEI